jgi:periplasmic divalent cation tolerance protein
VVSHYRWKGALQRDAERLLLIKTRAERVGALRAALGELHPYEVPELIVLQIAAGHAPYLAWLDESVLGGAARGRRAPAPGRPPGRRRPRSRR